MTFSNPGHNQHQLLESFQQFNVEDQLALLWFFYTKMRDSINPEPADTSTGLEIARGAVNQIQQLSHQEQLQVQRDILRGQIQQPIAQIYAEFNSSNRLAFWYLLAQGMENHSIVPLPSDYELGADGKAFFQAFEQMEFSDQLALMRNLVASLGPKPKVGAIA